MSAQSTRATISIKRVIETIDKKYDLFAVLEMGGKRYQLYIPRLVRRPDKIDLVSRDNLIELKIFSGSEGFCTCTLDPKKILEGCMQIRCLEPIGIWISNEEILASHKIEEISSL